MQIHQMENKPYCVYNVIIFFRQ